MSTRSRRHALAPVLFVALVWPLGGCVFAAEIGAQIAVYAIAGAVEAGGSERSGQGEPATIRVVKASLIEKGATSGAELSPAQCNVACSTEEKRCWYVEAYAPLLDEGVRVPMLACGDDRVQISRTAASSLSLVGDGKRFESQHCEQLCPEADGRKAATCSLQWQAAPPVSVLRPDEGLVLCERR